jgi:hypothetical protein
MGLGRQECLLFARLFFCCAALHIDAIYQQINAQNCQIQALKAAFCLGYQTASVNQ